MRKSWYLLLALLLVNIFWLVPSQAQERKATISGHITDADHAVLQGARVELQPNGHKTVSDAQGQFTISDLAPGHYTLTVSYVGFAQFSQELDVTSGQVAKVDAILRIGTQSEIVEVRGERQTGEVEALNIERTADNIIQVLPKEVITSLPNTNIADAVGRLPSVSLERDEGEGKYVQIRGTEPRLSNVTVDGVHLPSPENVRNVKLDAIPADLVEMVQVSKTLSANQEGDAIGGSVNLVTKSAGDKPYLNVLGMGGYTPIAGGRPLDQFDATVGNRFLSNKRLGLMIGGSYDFNARGIDDQEPSVGFNQLNDSGGNPIPGQFFAGPNGKDTREYWYYRTRFGFGGTLDYRFNDNTSTYVRGLFSQFKDNGEDWIYTASAGNFLAGGGNPRGVSTDASGSETFSHVTRKPGQRLFSTTAGMRHELGPKTVLTYDLAFGQARFTGFFPSTRFNGPGANNLPGDAPAFNIDTTNPFTPLFNVTNGVNIFDPNLFQIAGMNRGDDHTFERNVTGSVALTRQYAVGSHLSTFDVGMRIRDAHKSQLDQQQTFIATQDFRMSSVLSSFTNKNYYFGVYPLGPVTSYDKIVALFNANPNGFVDIPLADLARTAAADFNVDERVTAGYLMNTINLGHVRLQTGVRIEATQASFLGNTVPLGRVNDPLLPPGSPKQTEVIGPITPAPGEQSYIDALPSVQFQYLFNQNTVLRAAYGMGIARPNFGDLPPFRTFSLDSGGVTHISLGNPNLQREKAQNFDLAFERYLKPVGVIQAGVFYKYLTNPIFAVQSSSASGKIVQNQTINGPNAHLTGIEFAWQQHLSFLPGLLSGMGVRANYSYTTSTASFPLVTPDANNGIFPRTDHPALPRQAPNNWNFDATYDKKGISARMGLTHNDANIFFYNFQPGDPTQPDTTGGLKGPNGDVYLYPHTQVDAQVSYWLPKGRGLQLVGYGLNLTNETFGFYQGSEVFPIQREYYSRTLAVGLRWTNVREK
jgi:TonB-dependent receptor